MKNLQSPSMSLKPGGAITWSVCIQTKPVVTATARRIISPVTNTRRIGNTFGETDVFVDMAYSFLYLCITTFTIQKRSTPCHRSYSYSLSLFVTGPRVG